MLGWYDSAINEDESTAAAGQLVERSRRDFFASTAFAANDHRRAEICDLIFVNASAYKPSMVFGDAWSLRKHSRLCSVVAAISRIASMVKKP